MSWLTRKFRNVAVPPKARKENIKDIFHGIAVPDPYRHLENLDAPETLQWAHAQDNRFKKFVADYPRRRHMTTFLKDVQDYPKESLPARYKDKWFKSCNSGLDPQDILMIADSRNGPWRVLIDPNRLSRNGTVALSDTNIRRDGKKMIYLLSEAGSDEQILRIMDVKTGRDLPEIIEHCRFTGTSWDENGGGFLYTYPANDGKKNFIIRHHRLGDDVANDRIIYQRNDWEQGHPWISRSRKWCHEWLYEHVGTERTNGLGVRKKGDTDGFTRVFDNAVATFSVIDEIDGKILMLTDYGAPRGKLVCFNPYDPDPANWETVIPEHEKNSLDYVFHHKDKLYAGYSHDTADQIRIFDTKGNDLGEIPLPPQSVAGFGRINEKDDSFMLHVSGFQTPGATYEYNIKTGKLALKEKSKAKADLSDCIVERIHATSKDGTKVPMTIIRRKDTVLDGSAAVKLYGYGGFNVPLGPGFSFDTLNWVKNGGIYVQANLRGGGEFGREWYEQGRLQKKQNVFDDFIACAEHLIGKNYTSPARLVIEGGSNGGLLTAACALQRPELFGAVISDVPVTDMLRFHKHTYGAAWKSDYGDPENNKSDFQAAMKYSPLHNIKKGAKYPPILVQTADHDDRVVPSHAYKFVATLQAEAANDNLVMLHVEKDAGHGAGKPTEKIIAGMIDTFAFIEKTIGPVDQHEYKTALGQVAKKKQGPGPEP